MQCPSCEFHNTPGAGGCVRCGTRLDLAGVAIEPPRASSISAVRTARLMWLRAGIGWRDSTHYGAQRILGVLRLGDADWRLGLLMLLSIVPGMGQWWLGRRLLGGILLGVWLAMAAWALVSMGTDWNWVAVMCMLGTHSTGVNLLLGPYLRTRPPLARAGVGLAVYLVLLGGLYWPARLLSSRLVFTAPVHHFLASSRLTPGDVLLCQGPWMHGTEWNIGEVVIHSYRAANGRAGVVVDRIIAGPGDVVSISGGKLTVNGKVPPPFRAPLRPPDTRLTLTLSCPPENVVVFPSLLVWQVGMAPQADAMMSRLAESASVVPRTAIQGRVLARVRPLARLGLVD